MAQHEWVTQAQHPIYRAWTAPVATGQGRRGSILETRSTDTGAAIAIASYAPATEGAGAWERNERRLRGGEDVLDELMPFDHENIDGRSYLGRRAQATYVNFAEDYALTMVGHLRREAPTPGNGLSFGGLGEIRRERADQPTRAELLYYNASGRGNDGQQWDEFWLAAMFRAHATGHRWIFVEAPATRPGSLEDEIAGLRPYLIEYAPQDVTDWHYEGGRLAYAIIRHTVRRPRLVNGVLEANPEPEFTLLVATGYNGLGDDYRMGGWWRIDKDGEQARDDRPSHGNWDRTRGEIPMAPLFYQRDDGSRSMPAFSRPGTTELGQIAVSYMNLSSAADFDAIDAAASIQFLLNVDPDQFGVAADKLSEGSRWIPIPPPKSSTMGMGGGAGVSIEDASTGAVTADVFDRRLSGKLAEAERAAAREQTSTPDSSGRSKEAGFGERKGPRLALMAGNLEECQNSILYFLELRWGVAKPAAFVSWPREFDLSPLGDEARDMLELEELAGIRSPTVTARCLAIAVRDKRIIIDDAELKQVEAEYLAAGQRREADAERARGEEDAVLNALRGRETAEEDDAE
jgi:hypothetical protein